MDRILYVAMSGASQTLLAQGAVSHNLANVSTTGFKADLNQMRSMQVFGAGAPSRVYAMSERPGVDLSAGTLQSTGNELDVAVSGDGWIAVQAPDGSEAYTRAGDLHISSNGILVTGAGHPVLGNGGPIAIPPSEKLEIGGDGTISIRPLGQAASTLAELDRIKLVNPQSDQLEKGPDGLFRLTSGANAEADGSVSLVSGALESSNVNAVGMLVEMIALARRFEMQVKVMEDAKRNDESSTAMMRVS